MTIIVDLHWFKRTRTRPRSSRNSRATPPSESAQQQQTQVRRFCMIINIFRLFESDIVRLDTEKMNWFYQHNLFHISQFQLRFPYHRWYFFHITLNCHHYMIHDIWKLKLKFNKWIISKKNPRSHDETLNPRTFLQTLWPDALNIFKETIKVRLFIWSMQRR